MNVYRMYVRNAQGAWTKTGVLFEAESAEEAMKMARRATGIHQGEWRLELEDDPRKG